MLRNFFYIIIQWAVVVGIIAFFLSPFFRASSIIENWAQKNGFRVLKKSIRIIRTGPFFTTKNQAVYRVQVADNLGKRKNCWIKCGDYLYLDPYKIKIIWDQDRNTVISIVSDQIIIFLNCLFFSTSGIIIFLLLTDKSWNNLLSLSRQFIV